MRKEVPKDTDNHLRNTNESDSEHSGKVNQTLDPLAQKGQMSLLIIFYGPELVRWPA